MEIAPLTESIAYLEAKSGEDKAFLSVWLELGRGRDRRDEATGFDAETTSLGAGVRMPARRSLRLTEAAGAWEGPLLTYSSSSLSHI